MKIVIPRTADPKKKSEMEYTDMGDVDKPGEYVSIFKINDKLYINMFRGRSSEARYASDCDFLRKRGWNLSKAIFP